MEVFLKGSGQSIISVGGAFSWPDLKPVGPEPAYRLCVPLHRLDRVTGLILVGRMEGMRAFSRSDVEFLSINCAIVSGMVERLRGVSSKITSGLSGICCPRKHGLTGGLGTLLSFIMIGDT